MKFKGITSAINSAKTLKERLTAEFGLNLEDAYWHNEKAQINVGDHCSTAEDKAAYLAKRTGHEIEIIDRHRFYILGY